MLKKSITFQISHLKSLLESENSCVSVVTNFKGKLSLYPFHLGYLKRAVKELLDNKVSMYDPELNGIILGHSNIKVINSLHHSDSSVINLSYIADIYLFTPKIGKNLTGIVNKKSKEHIGCLIHSAFNATIPKPRTIGEDLSFWLKTHNAVQISNELEFTVSKVDLTSRVPYISGILVRNESDYNDEEVDSGVCCQDSIDEDNVKIKKKKRKSKDSVKLEDESDFISYHDPSQIAELFDNDVPLTKGKRKKSRKSDCTEDSDILSPPVKKIKKEKSSVEPDDQFVLPIIIKEEPDECELLGLHGDVKKETSFDTPSPHSHKKSKSKKISPETSFSLNNESLEAMTSSLLKEAMDNCFGSKQSGNSSSSETDKKKKKKKRSLLSPLGDSGNKSSLESNVFLKSDSTPRSSKGSKSSLKETNAQSEMTSNSGERKSKKRKRSESPVKSETEDSFSFKAKKKKSSKSKDSLEY